MTTDRRAFLALTGAALACRSAPPPSARSDGRCKAIVFDALAIFDSRPVALLAEALFPNSGSALMAAWRSRQFEYQWLHALGRKYVDFPRATQDSLVYAAKQLQLRLSPEECSHLTSAWTHLPLWPDTAGAVRALRATGWRLAILSNMTAAVLQEGLKAAQLDTQFEAVLSTDRIRSYKPDPAAYALILDELQLRREEILFVAFAGWDVAGAGWFGLPTFWLNRLGSPAEELHAQADGAGADLHALEQYSRTLRTG